MAPAKKTTKSTPRPRRGRPKKTGNDENANLQGIDEIVDETAKNESAPAPPSNPIVTKSSLKSILKRRRSSILEPTAAFRAARRISQVARRMSINRSSIGDETRRISFAFRQDSIPEDKETGGGETTTTQFRLASAASKRASIRYKKSVLMRLSLIQVKEISPLADKRPNFVRMPDDDLRQPDEEPPMPPIAVMEDVAGPSTGKGRTTRSSTRKKAAASKSGSTVVKSRTRGRKQIAEFAQVLDAMVDNRAPLHGQKRGQESEDNDDVRVIEEAPTAVEKKTRGTKKPRTRSPAVIPENNNVQNKEPLNLIDKTFMIDQPKTALRAASGKELVKDADFDECINRFELNREHLLYSDQFPIWDVFVTYRDRTNEAWALANSQEHGVKSKKDGRSQQLPWIELYRPRSSREFIGNTELVDRLVGWLEKWKKKLQKAEARMEHLLTTAKGKKTKATAKKRGKSSTYDDDDEDYEDEDEEDATLPNLAFVRGGTGVGKTCLVNALAEELGFKVLAVDSSTLRNQKQLLQLVEGATKNHRIDLKAAASTAMKKGKKGAASVSTSADPSTSGIQKYFVSAAADPPKKRSGRKTPPTTSKSIEVVTIDDDVDEGGAAMDGAKSTTTAVGPTATASKTGTLERAMTIILLDDVDVIFEQDEKFWNAVREIAQTAMVPIVLTCKDFDLTDLPLIDLPVERFQFEPIDRDLPSQYYRLLLLSRGILVENEKDFIAYCRRFDQDLRGLLTNLQFWLDHHPPGKIATGTKSRQQRAKTPPQPPVLAADQQPPPIDPRTKEDDIDEFGYDHLKYEMQCIADRYRPNRDVKWPNRVLDGTNDKRAIGSIKDETRVVEQPPDTIADRFAQFFEALMRKPRFAVDQFVDVAAGQEDREERASTSRHGGPNENVDQLQAFKDLVGDICPITAMAVFHRDRFVCDYRPYLRSMATTTVKESNGANNNGKSSTRGGRNRAYNYLHQIGLDQRSGNLQTIMKQNLFRE